MYLAEVLASVSAGRGRAICGILSVTLLEIEILRCHGNEDRLWPAVGESEPCAGVLCLGSR